MRIFERGIWATASAAITLASAFDVSAQTVATWTLSASPALTIGNDGTASREFSRIEAAFRLSNGFIAIANGSTSEVRVFDDSGRFVRAVGRRGSGPGEFQFMTWIGRAGDSAFLFDFRQKRITTLTLRDEKPVSDTKPITATSDRGPFFVSGRLADGRFLVQTGTTLGFDGPPGVHRRPGSVGTMDADAAGSIAWLARMDGLAVFVLDPTGNINQASVGPIAFSPAIYSAASGPGAWFGESGPTRLCW